MKKLLADLEKAAKSAKCKKGKEHFKAALLAKIKELRGYVEEMERPCGD